MHTRCEGPHSPAALAADCHGRCSGVGGGVGVGVGVGVSEETLYFSDRPYRHAFHRPTAEFVAQFEESFTQTSGGSPNAVVHWEDASSGNRQGTVVELLAPSYDEAIRTLTYKVMGLRLDDPQTLRPLPDEQQLKPVAEPQTSGSVDLFIDTAFPDCATCP